MPQFERSEGRVFPKLKHVGSERPRRRVGVIELTPVNGSSFSTRERKSSRESLSSAEITLTSMSDNPLMRQTHSHEDQNAWINRERQTAQSQPPKDGGHKKLRTAVEIGLEMIPGGLGPWGVGDAVTALEAVFGRTFVDGLKLTPGDRVVYLIASAVPVLPARPIVLVYHWIKNKATGQHKPL